MILFGDAIERGAHAGALSGIWKAVGRLPAGAYAVLSDPNRSNLTSREKGYRDGLVRTGHLRRRWWGSYERTHLPDEVHREGSA